MTELLMNILKEEQEKHSYLSMEILKKISKEQNIPVSKLYGVATFYTMLKTKPQGKFIIEMCGSPSCVLHQANEVHKEILKQTGLKLGETNKEFSLYKTSCIGCCDEAPAMLVNGAPYTNLTKEKVQKIFKRLKCKS